MTIDDLEELIGTIEAELNSSPRYAYRCIGGQMIVSNVGCVEGWFEEYKHVLRKRYVYEIAGEKG